MRDLKYFRCILPYFAFSLNLDSWSGRGPGLGDWAVDGPASGVAEGELMARLGGQARG